MLKYNNINKLFFSNKKMLGDGKEAAYINQGVGQAITNFNERVSELSGIGKSTLEDVARLRELSRSQKEFWKLIPGLAIEVRGREDISDLSAAVDPFNGYLALEKDIKGDSKGALHVDLEAGELMIRGTPEGQKNLGYVQAPDQDVVRLVFYKRVLNAEKLVRILEKEKELHEYSTRFLLSDHDVKGLEWQRTRVPEIFTRK
jgi:hypothetical protein